MKGVLAVAIASDFDPSPKPHPSRINNATFFDIKLIVKCYFKNTSSWSIVFYGYSSFVLRYNMMGDEVEAALNSMPVDFKTVILLCDIEGFSYEEIAKIIDIPVGTVRSRLFRARNMLKEKLEDYAKSLGYKDYRGDKNQKNMNDDN